MNEIEPIAPRRTREYAESFKGKRTGDTYECPIKESHGAMTFDGSHYQCIVKSEQNRVCSAWSITDLNPRIEHFVVGIVADPTPEPDEAPVPQSPATGPECGCGCGERTRGGKYRPGHDARHHARLKREALPA